MAICPGRHLATPSGAEDGTPSTTSVCPSAHGDRHLTHSRTLAAPPPALRSANFHLVMLAPPPELRTSSAPAPAPLMPPAVTMSVLPLQPLVAVRVSPPPIEAANERWLISSFCGPG